MGRTALYRDPIPFQSTRTDTQVDADALVLVAPDGGWHRHSLDGVTPYTIDGYATAQAERRFVGMRVLEVGTVVIAPPDQGAVAPSVVRVPEAPADAAIVDTPTWDTLADWLLGGGRLAACAIADLARLAAIP